MGGFLSNGQFLLFTVEFIGCCHNCDRNGSDSFLLFEIEALRFRTSNQVLLKGAVNLKKVLPLCSKLTDLRPFTLDTLTMQPGKKVHHITSHDISR